MDHNKAVMARRIKFILEKPAFISFAFNTHKGKNRKLHESIFPSKTGNKKQISEINKFLVTYFSDVIKRINEICESMSPRKSYDKYFKEVISDLHSGLEKERLCNKFDEDTPIFWSYFTKMVNIIIYELVTHNELVETPQFNKIKCTIHVPIDRKVISELKERTASIKSSKMEMNDFLTSYKRLDSINSEKLYDLVQASIREVQDIRGEPPIYIEDAYSLT